MTTWCSANLVKDAGSASRTLVSRTYVRRDSVATQTPLGAGSEPGAADRTRQARVLRDKRVGWTGAARQTRAAPALSPHEAISGGLPRGRPGEPSATSDGTHDQEVFKVPTSAGPSTKRGAPGDPRRKRYAPKRRLRSEYERSARRKSTLRNAGQYASQK